MQNPNRLLWIVAGVALVVGAASIAAPGGSDTDADGVPDAMDNCLTRSNASQNDSDMDGYGNACDADFDQNGLAGASDFGLWFKSLGCCSPAACFNPDVATAEPPFNCVGALELAFWRLNAGSPPGPSGLACADPEIDVTGEFGGTNNTPCS